MNYLTYEKVETKFFFKLKDGLDVNGEHLPQHI